MKIAIFSDLHLESSNFKPEQGDADVAVVCGDVWAGEPEALIEYLKKAFDIPVLFVPGNHDFEGYRFSHVWDIFKKTAQNSNVIVLNNESIEIEGIHFLGTPLYTGFRLFDELDPNIRIEQLKTVAHQVCDFSNNFMDDGRCWTPKFMIEKHDEARIWLEQRLKDGFSRQEFMVVLTHWPPSILSRDNHFPLTSLSSYFLNPCEELIEMADLWVHGHIHSSSEYVLPCENPNKGRVIANPRGNSRVFQLSYNPQFKNPKIFKLPFCPLKQKPFQAKV